jgi:hypothetical protein
MYLIIGRPKTFTDLNGHFDLSLKTLRGRTQICIIDDEIFPKKNALSKHDYQIKELGDITDINAIEAYQIILCDIKGVGKHFESEYEGGHIIEEINKYYPHKVIIAYTGEKLEPTYNRFLNLADMSIKKDASNDEWIGCLDHALNIVHNPIEQWKKSRKRLLQLSINSIDLIRAEDLFVKSYLAKDNLFKNDKYFMKMPEEIKQIILLLIESILLKKG